MWYLMWPSDKNIYSREPWSKQIFARSFIASRKDFLLMSKNLNTLWCETTKKNAQVVELARCDRKGLFHSLRKAVHFSSVFCITHFFLWHVFSSNILSIKTTTIQMTVGLLGLLCFAAKRILVRATFVTPVFLVCVKAINVLAPSSAR